MSDDKYLNLLRGLMGEIDAHDWSEVDADEVERLALAWRAKYLDGRVALERRIDELQRLVDVYGVALGEVRFISSEALKQTNFLTRPIDALELTVRTANVLRDAGMSTVGDLVWCGKEDLAKLKGLGRRSIAEIQEILAQYRLALRP